MASGAGSLSMDVHAVGSDVWVRDETDGWLKAQVVKVAGPQVTVKTEKGDERAVPVADCPLQNSEAQGGVEDMTELTHLHEPGVLWNLKKRYMYDDIYTYTGNILIAVNPFQAVPHLYGLHMMDMYKGQDLSGLSPHVYATAESAYRQMVSAGHSQSILVSGESGAGKTETCKLIMKYLAFLGGYAQTGTFDASSSGGVESKVLESNPLLEAFGNAKTVRNSNSSRFGKFTEIQFDDRWRIVGAAVRTYLLERSRVVAVNDPERNYHAFYQLCDGASPEDAARLHLRSPKDFRYLNRSSCYVLPGKSNAREYEETRQAMSVVGIASADQDAIFTVVAAVLHLGNCIFVEDPKDEAACILDSPESTQHLEWAAELLGVPSKGLEHALMTRTRQTPDGAIVSPITADAASNNRDSLAKTIYSRLFDYLVKQVNMSIGHVAQPKAVVGVLDIYGFEQFKVNDFEQFCINLANEKLQQHFNQHVFKMEQEEYEKEKIDWTTIEFVDNKDVLDLIERKPLGLLDALDETCRFPQATGATFAEKLYSNKDVMEHKRFTKPKRSNTAFIVDHYAGKVEYQVDHFLDKNKDFVVKEHQDLLGASTLPLISGHLFLPEPEPEAPPADAPGPRRRGAASSYKFVSVGSQFKKQLASLMLSLADMEPHYVRCIKPNGVLKPNIFDNVLVLQQLRCGGVLEAVRISCAGYPSRRLYFDFVDHFWHLAPDLARNGSPDVDVTMAVIKEYLESGYAQGSTKIFLKGGQMAILEKHRLNLLNKSATTIQKYVRGHQQGGVYRRLRRTVILMQSYVRMSAAKRLVERMRREKAAKVFQTWYRRARAQRAYARKRNAAIVIQSAVRAKNARAQVQAMREENAATTIQKYARGHKVRKDVALDHARATRVQNRWRCKIARRKLLKLRAEAKESGKLLEDKVALEQKLKEMQGVVASMQSSRAADHAKLLAEQEKVVERDSELAKLRAAAAKMSAEQADAMAAEVKALRASNEELEGAAVKSSETIAELHKQVAELQRELTDAKDDLDSKSEKHTAEVNRLRAERERVKKENQTNIDDLLQRLSNACQQRDEAREQVLALEDALEHQRTETEEKLAAAASASAEAEAAAVAAAATAATAAARASPAPAAHGVPSTPPRGGGEPAAAAAADMGTPPPIAKNAMDRIAGALMKGGTPIWTSPVAGGHHARTGGPMTPPPLSAAASIGSGPNPAMPPPSPAGGYESELDRRQAEMQKKQQQLALQQRNENQDTLISTIAQPLGFHKGRPVVAVLIFRCCIQWKVFELDRTNIFDRIITTIGARIEPVPKDDVLCYWLTNTVTLLLLLQKNLKPAATQGSRRGAGGSSGSSSSSGLFHSARAGWSSYFGSNRRASGGFVNNGDASIHGGGQGSFRQIAAKYPALLFKQQLDAYMGKIFPMLRDNVKKDVQGPLSQCIHAPRTSHSSRNSRTLTTYPEAHLTPWGQLLKVLNELRENLNANFVPAFLQRKLFVQLFAFINVQLFNQLLLRRECCSFGNGEYVKHGLAQVEEWVLAAGEELVGTSWEELRFIRQAVSFLVLHQKQKKSLREIRNDLCPELSVQQLYRISTMYWDDKYGTETVSGEVLQEMRTMMQVRQSQHGSASHSFLLDDDSSNPFNANDVKTVMDDKALYSEMPPPDALKDNRAFDFLARPLQLAAPPAQSEG